MAMEMKRSGMSFHRLTAHPRSTEASEKAPLRLEGGPRVSATPFFIKAALLLAVLIAGCAKTLPPPDLVWPSPPDEPKIRYLRAYSSGNEFGKTGVDAFREALFGEDAGGVIAKPYGVAADKEGRVYVTDSGRGKVWVFDEQVKQVTYLGTSGQGALKSPMGIAVDGRGVVFVSDVVLKRVFGFDRKGNLVTAIGKSGELERPTGLAIDPATNRLYVSDTRLHKVRVYDANTGAFVKEIGDRGSEEGKFNYPTNLFIRGDKLYVGDTGNFRVQVLDLDGKFLKKIGSLGDSFGNLARPKGIGVDSDGHIYVVDAAFDNFQIFNEEGKLLLFVGEAGASPGRFWLPAGMFIDERDRIYVADQYNNRVQVFQYLKDKQAFPVVDTKK